jgi:hypothetical protein
MIMSANTDKAESSIANLIHERLSTALEPPTKKPRIEHQCQKCSAIFTERRTLVRHQTKTECAGDDGDPKAYVCSYCNKSFRRHDTCKRHEDEKHRKLKRKPPSVAAPIDAAANDNTTVMLRAANEFDATNDGGQRGHHVVAINDLADFCQYGIEPMSAQGVVPSSWLGHACLPSVEHDFEHGPVSERHDSAVEDPTSLPVIHEFLQNGPKKNTGDPSPHIEDTTTSLAEYTEYEPVSPDLWPVTVSAEDKWPRRTEPLFDLPNLDTLCRVIEVETADNEIYDSDPMHTSAFGPPAEVSLAKINVTQTDDVPIQSYATQSSPDFGSFRLRSQSTKATVKRSLKYSTHRKNSPICILCHKPYERDISALRTHLDGHLAGLQRANEWHTCDICQVSFVHAPDLRHHQNSVAADSCCTLDRNHQGQCQGYRCGFNFTHSQPCTGHHPPRTGEDPSHSGDSVWSDHDRFRLGQVLRSWENAQLRLTISETERALRLRELGKCLSFNSLPESILRRFSKASQVTSIITWCSEPLQSVANFDEVQAKLANLSINGQPAALRRNILRITGMQAEIDAKLLQAAKSGDLLEVQRLLRRGARSKEASLVAAGEGQSEVLRALMTTQSPRDPDSLKHWNNTLVAAVTCHNDACAEVLLSVKPAFQHEACYLDPDVWEFAYHLGHMHIIDMLLSFSKQHCRTRCQHSRDLLAIALRAGSTDFAGVPLLGISNRSAVDQKGNTAVHVLIQHWSYNDPAISEKMLESLVQQGCAVSTPNHAGRSPLWSAARAGDVHAVKALLACGADPSCEALHAGILSGCAEAAELVLALLIAGADANQVDAQLCTPLHYAAAGGPIHGLCWNKLLENLTEAASLQCARNLLLHGADLKAVDGEGRTALARVVSRGHLESIKFFCAAHVLRANKSDDQFVLAFVASETGVISTARSVHGNTPVELLVVFGQVADPARRARHCKADRASVIMDTLLDFMSSFPTSSVQSIVPSLLCCHSLGNWDLRQLISTVLIRSESKIGLGSLYEEIEKRVEERGFGWVYEMVAFMLSWRIEMSSDVRTRFERRGLVAIE